MTIFDNEEVIFTTLVIGAVMLVVFVFFVMAQQKTLLAVSEEQRTLQPGQLWLQLIPIFGLVYQFTVIKGIADSLRNELETRNRISKLGIWDEGITDEVNIHPTYATGKVYAIMVCVTMIPFVGFITWIFTLILWITYWGQLNKFRRMLESYDSV